jgi:hypothetical protein
MSIPTTAIVQDAAPYVIRLTNHRYRAHACPVAPHAALTSRHVAFGDDDKPETYVWSDEVGGIGVVKGLDYSAWADLAIMTTTTAFARTFEIADTEPKLGDSLYLVNFDYSETRRPAMSHQIVSMTYEGRVGAQMNYKPRGTPGSSGSCVFNAEGKVVAINQGAPFGETMGHGVAVFGMFTPVG